MDTWTSAPWAIYMSLAMGVGAYIICGVISAWYHGAKIPKQHSEWVTELDTRLRDLQGAEIHRAVCYRRVADLMCEMPKDFDGRAILSKSEQLGMYPEGTFEKLGVIPHELPEAEPAPAPAHGKNGNGGSSMPWHAHFVHGRLVPAAKRILGAQEPPN